MVQKLFGSTINTCCDPLHKSHVQSYIFSMNKETCSFLINCGIFSKNYVKTFLEAVWNKEVLMSQKNNTKRMEYWFIITLL
uniref:Uncharacterized protein n=1 Tax=viral metagenome TaxID=1070528 RepID=A0A6C0ETS6_9ZZZZ